MAPEQYKGSFDYLNTLSVQQLQGILRSELEEEEVNIEYIKKINAVLASKEEKRNVDVEAAYKEFKAISDTEPLFNEVLDEMETRNSQATYKHPRVRHLAKFGAAAAIIVLLFIGTSIVAYAMGFNIWGAISKWTEDRLGLFAGGSVNVYDTEGAEDAYKELRDLMDSLKVSVDVVPNIIPDGFEQSAVSQINGVNGQNVLCLLECKEQNVVLRYVLLEESPTSVFTKDDGEPEIYTVNGIDHYIFSNSESYRAVWINGNVQCDFAGFTEKSELLRIIDSIYKE